MQPNFRTAGDRYMMTVDIKLRNALQFAALPVVLILTLSALPTQRCVAQTPPSAATVAALHASASGETGRVGGATDNTPEKTASAVTAPDPEISPAVAKQFAAMQAEIEELKAEL